MCTHRKLQMYGIGTTYIRRRPLDCYASILRKVPVKSLVLRLYHLYTILYSSLQFSHIPFDRLDTLSELLSLAVPVRSFLRLRLACGVLGTNIDISKGEL